MTVTFLPVPSEKKRSGQELSFFPNNMGHRDLNIDW